MATSIESQGTQRYVDFDEYIDFQLHKAGSGIKSTDILTALAGVAALVLGYLLVFVVFDHWVIAGGFGQTSRILMLALLGVLTIAWLVWKVGIPWIRQVNRLYAARMIERADPALKHSLLNLVDLRRAGKPVPPEILAAIEKRAALGISHIDLDHAVDRRPLARAAYALCAVVLIFCAYTLFSPKKISHSIWRALFPTAAVAAPTRTEILDVQPGDAEILARTQLEVTATVRGDIPEQVTLLYSTADRRFVDEPLEMREDGDELLRPVEPQPEQSGPRQYRVMIAGENGRGILQDLTYRIVAGDAVTRDYKVIVDQPPSARVDQVRYEYPDYMELEPREQPGGHVTAWEGTKVTLAATANMAVTSARLEFLKETDDSARVFDLPMQISDGTKLNAEWKLTISPDGTYPRYYRIQVRNEKEELDPQPTVYSLTIRPDQPPEVTLIDPTRDLERPANAIVPLMLQARDPDFKLSYLTLRIEKNGEPIPAGLSIFDGPPRPSFATTFEWDLKQHDLEAGDTLTYWIEARDNKTPDGNRRNTPKLNINIVEPVTPEQAAEQLQQEKERQQQSRDEAARDQNEDGAQEPPPPQDGDPQQPQNQQQDGQQGEQPMAGEQNQQEDGQQGEQQQEQPGQDGEQQAGGQRSGEGQQGGSQEQLDPNGDQDAEAIQKFLENQQRQDSEGQQGDQPPSEQGKQEQQPRREGDMPQDGNQSQEQDQEPSQEQQPNGKQPQGDQQSPSERSEQPSDAGQDGQQGTGQQPGTPGEQRKEPGDASDPSQGTGSSEGPKTPDAGNTGEPMPPSADPANRAAEKTDAPRDGQKGDPAGTPEGSEKDDTQGTSGQKGDPKGDEQQPTGSKRSGEEQGMEREKPASSDQGDQRSGEAQREQTGEQTDPNGQQEPTADQTSEAPMDAADPAQQGKGDPRDGSDARKGTQNPREADPAQQLKPQPNQPKQDQPDERSSEPSELGADKPPAKQDGQPEGANEPPQGEGAQEDQRSKSTDGGEVGSGNQSDQGKTGSNERGPGDSVDQPGNKGEHADQPSGGQEGSEKGPGSQSREAGDQEGEPAGGPDGPKKDASEAQGSEQGGGEKGEPTDQSGQGQSGEQQPAEGGKPGDSPAGDTPTGGNSNRPGRAGAEHPDGQGDAQPQPPPSQAEQANEEYGREAANMVLKKLEDQIKDGQIDQKWLEETGWTEEQAKRFAERLKRHLSQDQPATPEDLARQRQFDEMLRTLRKPDVGAPRTGENVRNAPSPEGITGPRRLPVPREYRELYEEYTRSRAKRTSPTP